MIPIRDENPAGRFPLVTLFLILANVAVHVYQMMLGPEAEAFVFRMGTIPWEITHFEELPRLPQSYISSFPVFTTLFSSMFLHASIPHLLGNMLYLWIFGDNVEALMGHVRFVFFYILCGLIATGTHIAITPNSPIPLVGASGAISGILGAYFLRFPRARIHVLFIWLLFIRIVPVPAIIVLGLWFLLQVLSGLGSAEGGSGVAWFAHIGGFIAGFILVLFFEKKDRVVRMRRSRI